MLTQETQGQFVTLICICRINIYKGWVMPPCFAMTNKKATYCCLGSSPHWGQGMSKWLHLLTTTTTGQILTENQKGCQEPRSKGTEVGQHSIRKWGLILPFGGVGERIPQGTGVRACSVIVGVWGFNHGLFPPFGLNLLE